MAESRALEDYFGTREAVVPSDCVTDLGYYTERLRKLARMSLNRYLADYPATAGEVVAFINSQLPPEGEEPVSGESPMPLVASRLLELSDRILYGYLSDSADSSSPELCIDDLLESDALGTYEAENDVPVEGGAPVGEDAPVQKGGNSLDEISADGCDVVLREKLATALAYFMGPAIDAYESYVPASGHTPEARKDAFDDPDRGSRRISLENRLDCLKGNVREGARVSRDDRESGSEVGALWQGLMRGWHNLYLRSTAALIARSWTPTADVAQAQDQAKKRWNAIEAFVLYVGRRMDVRRTIEIPAWPARSLRDELRASILNALRQELTMSYGERSVHSERIAGYDRNAEILIDEFSHYALAPFAALWRSGWCEDEQRAAAHDAVLASQGENHAEDAYGVLFIDGGLEFAYFAGELRIRPHDRTGACSDADMPLLDRSSIWSSIRWGSLYAQGDSDSGRATSPWGWPPAPVTSIVIEEGVGASSAFALFENMNQLVNIDVNGLTFTQPTDASYAFRGCESLVSVDFSGIDLTNIRQMDELFSGCSSLVFATALMPVEWAPDTGPLEERLRGLFTGCDALEWFDFSGVGPEGASFASAHEVRKAMGIDNE